jgi:hypothetical protein
MKPRLRLLNSRFILFLVAVSSFLLVSVAVFASQDAKDKLYENDGQRHICSAVKTTIQEGMSSLDVVRTAIELGNSPCLMVKCAIYGGGDLKQIISGAMQAGATSDVVSRCAIDAGADSREVSASLMQAGVSLCYFEPEGLPYTPPADNPAPFEPIPKPNPDPPISQSSF